MKNFATLCIAALGLAILAPAAGAQINPPGGTNTKNHGNIGVYFDFTRLQDTNLNMLGVGGRIGFNVQKHIVLEAEMAYDFEQTKTQAITVGSLTNTVRTNVRQLHALFGPKIQFGTGHTRFFALAKAGIVNFGVGGPATAGAINKQIGNILDGDYVTAIYPGGGVDFNIGRISFRAEAGDEIQLARGGSTHNFRATFGPQLRF